MRSPSPAPDADSLSDTGQPSSTSEPSPPVRHNRATTAARAAPGRQGQKGASGRHADHNGPGHEGTPLATKLSVDHESTTTTGSGVSSGCTSSALAEQTAVPNKQTATTQDAAQQTVTSLECPVPDKHDASVQSEGPVLPDTNRQPRTAVPTGERGTQTPIGHASPRPLQKAPPGRQPQWSPSPAAHEAESRSRAQADSYSFGHARASPSQGSWPARQSPPTQWVDAAVDPFSYRDGLPAQRDAHSIFTSSAADQQLAGHTQRPAQRLFCSPPPDGDSQQPVMQPPQHLPAEQQAAAFNSQAQQQDADVPRSAAKDAMTVLAGYQDADHPIAGTSNNPAEGSPSVAPAGGATRSAHHTVGAGVSSSSNLTGLASAPPTATPTQAQAGLGSAWPNTPAAPPYMAGPSLQPQAARGHAHLPSHVPWVPQQQAPHLLGGGYAYMQSLPTGVAAQPAVLHADSRGVHRGSGAGQRAAADGVPVSVMHRQQGLPGMYGLPRYMYPGASLPDWSA